MTGGSKPLNRHFRSMTTHRGVGNVLEVPRQQVIHAAGHGNGDVQGVERRARR